MSERKITNNILLLVVGCAVVLLMKPQATSASKKQEAKKEAQEEKDNRSKLRAFYTAPPVVPHEVTTRDSEECLYCHSEVAEIGGRTTIETPHPQFSNCQQCHVQGALEKPLSVENSWKGLEEPKEGTRAHELAPPTIPHRIFLRENCLSCHGPNNPDENMRTLHPDRTNCRQCHVMMDNAEFEGE